MSQWKLKQQIKLEGDSIVHLISSTKNGYHIIFDKEDMQMYQQFTKKGKIQTIKKIKIPDDLKIWGKQFCIMKDKLICLVSDGKTGDLIQWRFPNGVNAKPESLLLNIKCENAIIASHSGNLHIIGSKEHLIYDTSARLMKRTNTSFEHKPSVLAKNNKKTMVMLDAKGNVYIFGATEYEWQKLDVKIPDFNWSTQVVVGGFNEYLLALSGGEDTEFIVMDDDGNFLDDYNKNIYVIPLDGGKIMEKSIISLPVELLDSYAMLTTLSKKEKDCVYNGYFKKEIKEKKISPYVGSIIISYFTYEMLHIFGTEGRYSINVDKIMNNKINIY